MAAETSPPSPVDPLVALLSEGSWKKHTSGEEEIDSLCSGMILLIVIFSKNYV